MMEEDILLDSFTKQTRYQRVELYLKRRDSSTSLPLYDIKALRSLDNPEIHPGVGRVTHYSPHAWLIG